MYGLKVQDSLDSFINETYSEKLTVNLEDKSTLKPEDFWNSMELLALNNKVSINFRLA